MRALVSCLAVALACSVVSADWTSLGIIDQPGSSTTFIGTENDAFYDWGTDLLHAAYVAQDPSTYNFSIKYGWRSTGGGGWTTEVVGASTDDVSYGPSVAIDVYGATPGVAYQQSDSSTSEYSLIYAVRSGGSWTYEVVDGPTLDEIASDVDMEYDGNGVPYIAAYDTDNMLINLYDKSGGSWSSQQMVAISAYPENPRVSLAFDLQGNPTVAYVDDVDGDDLYEIWLKNSSGFAQQLYESTNSNEELIGDVALAYDNAGNPHVAFRAWYEENSQERYRIYHTTSDGQGGWETTVVTDTDNMIHPSISIGLANSGNTLKIGFDEGGLFTDSGNVYAAVSSDGGTTWTLETVESSYPGTGFQFVEPRDATVVPYSPSASYMIYWVNDSNSQLLKAAVEPTGPEPIPEPGTMVLLILGLAAGTLLRRRHE